MAEATDNLALRLLQDIRAQQDAHGRRFDGIEQRISGLERRMEDVNESVSYALGLSAHADIAYETTGQRLDRLTETVADPKARLETLEGRE